MIASAPAWAVWLALGLWGVAISALCFAVFVARTYWRQLQPQLAPLKAMLPMLLGDTTTSASSYLPSSEDHVVTIEENPSS